MISWDERYSADPFIYGTAPNRWVVEQALGFPPRARILSLGEGEGRNAVWLAEQGYTVDAVDGSPVGLQKARRLAAERGVAITTTVDDLAHHRPAAATYDALVLVYVHLPPSGRAWMHARGEEALRAGGLVILEAFSPRQLSFSSGGPRQADMLYDVDLLRADFPRVSWDVLEDVEIDLNEGTLHRGRAAVVRGVGRVR